MMYYYLFSEPYNDDIINFEACMNDHVCNKREEKTANENTDLNHSGKICEMGRKL